MNIFKKLYYKIYYWYNTYDVVEYNLDHDKLLYDMEIPTIDILDTKKYKITLIDRNKEHYYIIKNSLTNEIPNEKDSVSEELQKGVEIEIGRLFLSFRMTEDLVFIMDRKDLREYTIWNFQRKIDELLDKYNWTDLYIREYFIQLYFSKEHRYYSNRLRKLLRMGYIREDVNFKIYTIFSLGGFHCDESISYNDKQ